MILRHSFTPPNNTRLAHLCGPLDEHLRTIERALDVKIAHRHEQFKVDGHKAKAERAMEILQALYEQAARPITPAMVQLMLVGDPSELGSLEDTQLTTRRTDLRARTSNQGVYLQSIAANDITFGIGPAGTGKTYLAVACAVDALERGSVQRIVLTRPAVEAGERLGFLPGDMNEKVDPYMAPVWEALTDIIGAEQLRRRREKGEIEVAPIAFLRGRTLSHAFIIIDEAQNTTRLQMKMVLTRIGEGSRMAVTGDPSQIDLVNAADSGLAHAVGLLEGVQGVGVNRFSVEDVVRHPMVERIVRAYDADGMMTAAEIAAGADLAPIIERMLAAPGAAYLHAHNAGRGCFAARIDRN